MGFADRLDVDERRTLSGVPERFGLVDVFWAGERVGGAWEDGVLSPSCG